MIGEHTEFDRNVHVQDKHIIRDIHGTGGKIQRAPDTDMPKAVDNFLRFRRGNCDDCQIDLT